MVCNNNALQSIGYGKIDPVNKTSTTHTAITDQAGLSHINTGNFKQEEVQNQLNPILINDFNQEQALKELNAQVVITTEFSKEAPKTVAKFADKQAFKLIQNLDELNNKNIDITSDEYQNTIKEIDKWSEGGVYRTALHTAMGLLATGTVEGGLSAGTTAYTIPKIDEYLKEQGFDKEVRDTALLALSAGIGATVGDSTASTVNNVGQVEWNYLSHVSLEKVRKGQLTIEEAEQLSQRLDKEAEQLCSNNPTSDACRTAISSQIQYIAMQEAWSVMKSDVSRTSKQTFNYLYNTPNANTRFVNYFNTIDNRANFFAASNQYEKNLGVGARWFGGADKVSRAKFTGLGADGNLSYVTFGMGSVFSGNPKHIYDWRKEAGDALMKGGFNNFKHLYNNRPNAMQWDIKQLRDEQVLLQPIHEKYLSDKDKFRGFSSWMTDSENRKYTGKFIEEEQTQPGGIDILDKSSRIRYGCKLLGYSEGQGCKP
ncbi:MULTISPECIES: hypothetical protein [Moraxella]|uniref:Uncharacterized protein n=1 Tax=Moraxella catarrhalis TaxID=480 RepID=A0A7Z0UZA2_MORCA|nr:hypothetical protein [Moraxella catarrhalis]OAV01404.1 hypothetical protein AO382_0679 [Moraxella catarrhalis]STY81701.1 Uncharacterised protein [Moraxella catarrhalis]